MGSEEETEGDSEEEEESSESEDEDASTAQGTSTLVDAPVSVPPPFVVPPILPTEFLLTSSASTKSLFGENRMKLTLRLRKRKFNWQLRILIRKLHTHQMRRLRQMSSLIMCP